MTTTVVETFVARGSSNIAQFTYDPSTQTLVVEFQSGDEYSYDGVPASVYDAWCQDGGGGKFFIRHIKNRFSYEKQ